MIKTPEFIKNRIIWRANQHKLSSGFTFMVDNLPYDKKNDLGEIAKKYSAGIPIIYFTNDSGQWTLLCSNSIIGFDNDSLYNVQYADIHSMVPEFLYSIPKGQPIDVTKTKKSEWNQLVVENRAKNKFIFYTRTGQDHFALMNIILMLRNLIGTWRNE